MYYVRNTHETQQKCWRPCMMHLAYLWIISYVYYYCFAKQSDTCHDVIGWNVLKYDKEIEFRQRDT